MNFDLVEAVGSGWAARKMFGPTLDQIGQDIRSGYSEQRTKIAARILSNARQRLGDQINDEGKIHPRVALKVLEEGTWSDDAVSAEYFGGILAAARSSDGSGDRGIIWANMITGLSEYDLLLHYLIYSGFRQIHLGNQNINPGAELELQKHALYLPMSDLASAGEGGKLCFQLGDSLRALRREDLVGPNYAYGPPETLDRLVKSVPGEGIALTLSASGADLFMWANAYRNALANYLNPAIDCTPVDEIPVGPSSPLCQLNCSSPTGA